ncbi:MAG TPA: sialidase family protein, partial [Nitriliruptorales bacterium]|nr:sialidase family protein [Nitriliruptorales bacterium]
MGELTGERVRKRTAPSLLGPVLALLAALFGGVAAVGAVLLLMADRGVVVHGNEFVNPAGLVDANNSPTIVRNPTDPENLVIVNRIDRPGFAAALHYSVDGGLVWRSNVLPLPDGLDRPYAPDAAFADDGTLHVTYVNLTGPGNVPQNLWLARSDDGGRTLSEPSRVAGDLSFQAQLAVAPDGTIHVTYLQASSVGTLQLVGPARVVAVASRDGGRTWSEPAQVSDPRRARVGAATPVIDSHGELVVLYQDFKGDVRDFQNLEGPAWPEPFGLVVTRSTDGGATFTPGNEIESEVAPTERFLVFLPPFPSIAAGPDRSLAVTWSDARNGDADVFLRRSPDGER